MMYLRGPHAGGAILWPGARGKHPALVLPSDQVSRGQQGEGGAILAVSGDGQVEVSLGDVQDPGVGVVRVNHRIGVTLHSYYQAIKE